MNFFLGKLLKNVKFWALYEVNRSNGLEDTAVESSNLRHFIYPQPNFNSLVALVAFKEKKSRFKIDYIVAEIWCFFRKRQISSKNVYTAVSSESFDRLTSYGAQNFTFFNSFREKKFVQNDGLKTEFHGNVTNL